MKYRMIFKTLAFVLLLGVCSVANGQVNLPDFDGQKNPEQISRNSRGMDGGDVGGLSRKGRHHRLQSGAERAGAMNPELDEVVPDMMSEDVTDSFDLGNSRKKVALKGTQVTIDNIIYDVAGDTAIVSDGKNCSGAVTIPSSITYNGINYPVTTIGNYAFRECSSLTSVTIPNSVTTIGNYAFRKCSSLTSVTIGNSVTTIGEEAFSGCSSLTSVTIGNSVTTIGNYAFRKCSSLTSVTIGNSVTTIGYYAFRECSSLTSVTIPNSVTTIDGWAFGYCSSLTSVTIPNSVTTIGYYAFSGCSSLTSVTIGNSVTTIGNSVFSGCSSLTSVTIPNSVTTIGNSVFSGCSSLTSVYCKIKKPLSISSYTFRNVPFSSATLYVPKGSKQAYASANYWKDFGTIAEMDFSIKGDVNEDDVLDVSDTSLDADFFCLM